MSIPKTMKAARLTKFNQAYEIQEVPVPKYGENDLLLKVGAAGFCHTDYQVYEGVYQSKLPVTASHEPVGTVVALGDKASKSWKIGQRVGMLNLRHACNDCGGCRNYREGDLPNMRFCENKEMAGIQDDGGFAEYVVADADSSSLLPDGLSFEQAAPMMCAGATVWGGISKLELSKDLPVAVIGIGGLGQLAIQFLKALGHPTIAIDNRKEGKDLAREVGPEALRADKVVDYNAKDAAEQVIKFGGDAGGVAGVVVCTDDVPATGWSLKILRPRGVCVPLGLPPDGFKFGAFDLVFKEQVIRGSLVATKPLTDEMMKIVEKHGIRSHITTIDFKDVPKLPEMYMDKHLKGRLVLKM
ncbi:Alcohol dehydrogenase [Ascochyta lentis]